MSWKCLLVVSLCLSQVAFSRRILLLGVVDEEAPNYSTNLATAVEYLSDPEISGILEGHEIELETRLTLDNDSFAAMEDVCALVPDGIDVMVDMSSRFVSATMRSLAEAVGIPHIASVDPSLYEFNNNREYRVSVNIEPPSSIMLYAIRDIVSQENLTNVGIIYDASFDMHNKPKRLLRNIPAQHLYLRMGEEDDAITEQLDKIKNAELYYLFLACSAHNANKFLGLANARGMMSFKYSWYVLTKDSKVSCADCARSSSVVVLTGQSETAPTNSYVQFMDTKVRHQANLNFNRENIEMAAAFQFDIMKLIGTSLDSLLKSGSWNNPNYTDCYQSQGPDQLAIDQAVLLKQTIKDTPYTGVFGTFNWEGDIAKQEIKLDIKRVTFESGVNVEEELIGNWTARDHLHAFDGSITNKNVKKSYRVILLKEPPFVFKEKTPPDETVKDYYYDSVNDTYYYGYCIELLFHINRTMQFEFTLVEPDDGAYGTMQPDGTWNGMVNELIQDKADIIVAPLSVMAERENVIDFTVPYYDLVGITILMKKPTFEYSVFRFMSVLEDAVWGCVFSAFIIVSVLLAVFDKFSPYSYQNNRDSWDGQGEEPRVFTLKEGLWFCMTSLTPQGGGEAPRALSGRLVAATWWMFGFIMIATYTANLAAFLTVSRLDQPIESLDDLAKQFKTKYAPQESTSTETYFRRMSDIEEKFYSIWKSMSLNDSLDQVERAKLAVWDYPVSDKFTNMWVSMQESGFPKSFGEAIERIKNPDENEGFAFIGDATQNKYATLTDCGLWEVGEEFSRKPYALAVQEGSPLKNELSSVILQLLNQRVLEDLKTFWWEYNREECPKIENESDGITIYNIGGVFLVIFIGIGLGLITLGFEYYWYRVRPGVAVGKEAVTANGKMEANGHIPGLTQEDNVAAIKDGHHNMSYDPRPL